MLKKLASVLIIAAIVCALGGNSAFARNPSTPDTNFDTKTDPARASSEDPAKKDVKPNERLKTNLRKLVDEAKAGKVLPAPKSQIQPARSNSWSKGTKIAVGVGVAVAVVVVILVVKHERDHLFDGLAF